VNGGVWKVGGAAARPTDMLAIRFSSDPPPPRMPSGVFLRGGSLLAGSLTTIIGDVAEVSSNALGPLKLKREDVAGAFSPLPPGQAENMPELGRYAALLGATLGTPGAKLQPGKRCRVRFAGLDELQGERIMRVGSDQILMATKSKGVETVSRQFVRMIEMSIADGPPPGGDARLGPEMIVRLKGGDLLRGRVAKLDDKSLTLQTACLGERQIERGMLAALFAAGGEGSGVVWLSAQAPTKAVHIPMFDSDFPARMDASVDGNSPTLRSSQSGPPLPCERGIGVHSRSELEFAVPAGGQRFISLCGIDNETKGRGVVTARALADGRELWKAPGPITGKDAAFVLSLELGGARALSLQVDFGPDDDDSGDHFDWGWAAIVK
ncbi:MAG: NPCBM/NEW2 domain-containing protein, partial [Planctomycetota bacterium]|nr:NPCBM/NEW2 domain-containing protein [Planctomycetota bacterium]